MHLNTDPRICNLLVIDHDKHQNSSMIINLYELEEVALVPDVACSISIDKKNCKLAKLSMFRLESILPSTRCLRILKPNILGIQYLYTSTLRDASQ